MHHKEKLSLQGAKVVNIILTLITKVYRKGSKYIKIQWQI